MTPSESEMQQDITLVRYLQALEAGDLDTLEAVWRQAETDPELEKALAGFNEELLLEIAGSSETAEPDAGASDERLARERLVRLSRDLLPAPRSPDEVVDASFVNYRCTVLVVDDEKDIRNVLRRQLSDTFEVYEADSLAAAAEVFTQHPVDILLTDQRFRHWPRPGNSGVELTEWVHEHFPHTVCILMTAYFSPEELMDAINRGHIYHYIPKPFPAEQLLEVLQRAAHLVLLERKNKELVDLLKQLNMELDGRVRERTRELVAAIHELQHKAKMLKGLAMTDQLTDLPNRRAMDNLAARELLWRRRYPGPLAIGLIDIDHFKRINQDFLWSGGDKVLTEVCRCMSRSIRTIDYLGRYGGEEFMVIAPQTDVKGAEVLAERIRREVERTVIPHKGRNIQVTVSLGLAVAEAGVPAEFEQMRDVYESALAEAKEVRNRCVVRSLPAPQQVDTGGAAHPVETSGKQGVG